MRFGVAGGVVIVLVALAALFAPFISPDSPTAINLGNSLQPPFWMSGGSTAHLLGTDVLGRDELSRLIYAARVSLTVGIAASAIAVAIGVPLGIIAGYMGGLFDSVIGVILNILLAFPFLLLALLIAAVVGPGFANVIIILGVTGWPIYTRIIRAQVLEIRERDFVKLARAMGLSHTRVMLRHVLPGIWGTFLVIASLQVGQMILSEAFLSFLGLGVQPPQPSWGEMLSDGQSLIFSQWWLTLFPGLAIFITVLSVNLFGDGLRDLFDPAAGTNVASAPKGLVSISPSRIVGEL
jgi:ABC-type dipeptide/oligopeptide/nickel transport system permease subunit